MNSGLAFNNSALRILMNTTANATANTTDKSNLGNTITIVLVTSISCLALFRYIYKCCKNETHVSNDLELQDIQKNSSEIDKRRLYKIGKRIRKTILRISQLHPIRQETVTDI